MSFLDKISNWDNHRPLLFLGLQNTTGSVLELGMGAGSTPFLHKYCASEERKLLSADNNPEYYNEYKSLQNDWHTLKLVNDWDELMPYDKYGLVLIDHAPAERRSVDAVALRDKADIIIVHDAEHEGLDYDVYLINKIAAEFKYRIDLVIHQHAAKTVMFSNKIDVSKFKIPNFNLY